VGYKVIEDSSKFNVVERRPETKEEIVIKSFATKDEAKTFSRHLNLGGGFDGWTPDFFLVR
jgi:hypothetical protein